MDDMYLSDLAAGESCVVKSFAEELECRRRLYDLGLCPGNKLSCAYIAPSGSPIAFWVKGALIALRYEQCLKILVQHNSE